MLKASVILSAHNQQEALDCVLAGLMTQTFGDFELLIADDGSDESTRSTIHSYRIRAPFKIEHFWQEHKGFRKCRILNRAIGAACGEVLIFLDGDCVPHKEYVAQHVALQDKGFYVAGRRVDLSRELTAALTPKEIEAGALSGSWKFLWRLWLDSLRGDQGSTPFHRAYMVQTPWVRQICGLNRVVDLKGCNFSVPKKIMEQINGFDESYEGYGREDTDVEVRLQNLGLRIKSAKNLCLQFHLWHERRAFTPVNENLLEEVKKTRRVNAIRGLKEGLRV